MILLVFAFLSGLVTILAPCIWPILPIVLSASVAGGKPGKARPLGITLGVMTSFTIFTLSVSFLVSVLGINPGVLRLIASIIIGLLAIMMIVPKLATYFELVVGRLANVFGQQNSNKGSGFAAGFLTGLSLGLVWSPCAGPILASIATLSATGGITLMAIAVTVAYVCGVGVPLFAFAYGGQKFLARSKLINKFTGRIQQVFGVIMLLMAMLIYKNYDVVLQAKLLEKVPVLGKLTTGIESSKVVQKELENLTGRVKLETGVVAPEFAGITNWLGSKPLTMASLKGKVVLVDFWTYTCINCVRTLPYVTKWYDTYKDKGFVVVGVHTPEFAFEKETKNVESAMTRYGIHYPVAQDNDFATWNAYNNQYWPAHYLIDATGKIRMTHFGEGKYEETEEAIRELLLEAGQTLGDKSSIQNTEVVTGHISPETYLGAKRMLYMDKVGKADTGRQEFLLNKKVNTNHFSLGGTWTIRDEYAEATKNANLVYNFQAKAVYLVMRPPKSGSGSVKVYVDDILTQEMVVDSDRLYDLVKMDEISGRVLRLEFSDGVQAFAFTFG